MLCMLFSAACAQSDVTTFLGIPVDGTKPEMIQKLRAKGYTLDSSGKYLTGEFNGRDVQIYVVTNNNKVYRIMVTDANTLDETDIRIRFNNLCSQFAHNGRYLPALLDVSYYIQNDEDISYNMTVKNKRYEACYYQVPSKMSVVDSLAVAEKVLAMRAKLLEKYTEEQLADTLNRTKEMSNDISKIKAEMMLEAFQDYRLRYSQNSVWFMISEFRGEYYITMFYDNERNMADGSEL